MFRPVEILIIVCRYLGRQNEWVNQVVADVQAFAAAKFNVTADDWAAALQSVDAFSWQHDSATVTIDDAVGLSGRRIRDDGVLGCAGAGGPVPARARRR